MTWRESRSLVTLLIDSLCDKEGAHDSRSGGHHCLPCATDVLKCKTGRITWVYACPEQVFVSGCLSGIGFVHILTRYLNEHGLEESLDYIQVWHHCRLLAHLVPHFALDHCDGPPGHQCLKREGQHCFLLLCFGLALRPSRSCLSLPRGNRTCAGSRTCNLCAFPFFCGTVSFLFFH